MLSGTPVGTGVAGTAVAETTGVGSGDVGVPVTAVGVGGKVMAVGVGGNVIAVGVGGNVIAVGVGGNVIEVGVGTLLVHPPNNVSTEKNSAT